jgi:hypothetical protein
LSVFFSGRTVLLRLMTYAYRPNLNAAVVITVCRSDLIIV